MHESGGVPEMDPETLGFGRLFSAIRDAVVVGDADSDEIVLWNPAATTLFGHTEAEAVGRQITMLVPPALRERHLAGMARYRMNGTGPIIGSQRPVELTALRRDGREIPVELTLGPMSDVGGRRYVLAILRDRSEAKAAEEQRIALEHERAVERARSELFQMASHEIRTPLTIVRGLVELAARRLDRGQADAARRDLEGATRSIDDLSRLVDDLFDVTRIKTGRFDVRPEPIDLAALLRDVAAIHAAPGREIVVDGPAAIALHADPLRLRQVLNNLIRNALAYSPHGSPVRIEAAADPHRAIVRVRDRGIGIPEDQRDGLFQPFFRARNVGERRGSGLGLYISRRIAELHGGTVTLETSDAEGTTFVVELPRTEGPAR